MGYNYEEYLYNCDAVKVNKENTYGVYFKKRFNKKQHTIFFTILFNIPMGIRLDFNAYINCLQIRVYEKFLWVKYPHFVITENGKDIFTGRTIKLYRHKMEVEEIVE